MLKTQLLHPQILDALGRAGHASKVLIADGNYPFSTRLGPKAALVCLNLAPGLVDCVQVLQTLLTAIPVEGAAVLQPPKSGPYAMASDPPIWGEFSAALKKVGYTQPFERLEKAQFYDIAGAPDVALTIATGERRVYANLLLTIGAVMPD